MTARTVVGRVLLPDGTVPTYATVMIDLVAATSGRAIGWVPTADLGVGGRRALKCDGTGAWTADLRPNSLIVPSGTVYRLSYSAANDSNWSTSFTISVPDSAGPHRVEDILVDPPATLPTAALTAHIDDTTAAHAASAISFTPTGTIAATDVQAALAEVAAEAGSSTLDGLTDVTAAGATTGQVLRKSAGDWTAQTLTAADVSAEAAGAVSTHAALTTGVHGISAFGATLVDDANASTARGTLELGSLATASSITASSVSDFAEAVDDEVASLLVAGSGIALTYNDGANSLTIATTGGGGAVATDTLWDAKGDLAVGTGADTAARLIVGANRQTLYADSATSSGLRWARVASEGGDGNISVGSSAQNTLPSTGTNNIAIGANTQAGVTSGSLNVAIGAEAQLSLTSGSSNFALGFQVQRQMTTGANNVGIGSGSHRQITTGVSCTAVGSNAQNAATTAQFCVAVGEGAGQALTVAWYQTAIGRTALGSATTGWYNTGVGAGAGQTPAGVGANATTTAANQTFVGANSGQASATQRDNVVAVGYDARVDGAHATAVGVGTLAGAGGAVAIGRSSAGVAASTTTADDIRLGVAAHTVTILGRAAVGAVGSFGGGGTGVVFIANAGTVPSSNPVDGGVLYSEGGALKWRGSSGAVTTIAPA